MHHRRASSFQTNPKNTAEKLVTSSKEILPSSRRHRNCLPRPFFQEKSIKNGKITNRVEKNREGISKTNETHIDACNRKLKRKETDTWKLRRNQRYNIDDKKIYQSSSHKMEEVKSILFNIESNTKISWAMFILLPGNSKRFHFSKFQWVHVIFKCNVMAGFRQNKFFSCKTCLWICEFNFGWLFGWFYMFCERKCEMKFGFLLLLLKGSKHSYPRCIGPGHGISTYLKHFVGSNHRVIGVKRWTCSKTNIIIFIAF